MQFKSKYNKGIRFLLCEIDLFSKYAWFITTKDKKGISIVNAFQKILVKSKRKQRKTWVDEGSEFYNSQFQRFLKNNNIEMYSLYNEGKFALTERFIRTLQNKILKHMKAVSKNVYFDALDDIVKNYNNTFHRTIEVKAIDVKSDFYSEFNVDSNKKDPKFKVGDHVRMSKFKNIFAKRYTPNWSEEEIFVIINNIQFMDLCY